MKVTRKKGKGFTLIELLVTIAVLMLITFVAVITTINIIEKSNERKNQITIANVKESAAQYIKEFKQSDNHWFIERVEDDGVESLEEYACTTINMLINKGILKSNILGTKLFIDIDDDGKLEEKELTRDTSIRINRDLSTKVYNSDVVFNDSSCLDTSEINVKLEKENDPKGNNNWYTENVEISINVESGESLVDTSVPYEYTAKIGSNSEKTISPSVSGNIISVGENGKDIDVCVSVTDYRDNVSKFCLSATEDKYKMDNVAPSSPKLVLATNNGYKITTSNAQDNLSSNKNLKYTMRECISGTCTVKINSKTGSTGYSYTRDTSITDSNGVQINSWVVDEAGNRSGIISKTLIVNASKSELISRTWECDGKKFSSEADADTGCASSYVDNSKIEDISTKYLCTTTGIQYDTYDSALANCYSVSSTPVKTTYTCSKDGSVERNTLGEAEKDCENWETITSPGGEEKITYYCSYTDQEYDTKRKAENACTDEREMTGDYEIEYYCDGDNHDFESEEECETDYLFFENSNHPFDPGRTFIEYYNKNGILKNYCGYENYHNSVSEKCKVRAKGISLALFKNENCTNMIVEGEATEQGELYLEPDDYSKSSGMVSSGWKFYSEHQDNYICIKTWYVPWTKDETPKELYRCDCDECENNGVYFLEGYEDEYCYYYDEVELGSVEKRTSYICDADGVVDLTGGSEDCEITTTVQKPSDTVNYNYYYSCSVDGKNYLGKTNATNKCKELAKDKVLNPETKINCNGVSYPSLAAAQAACTVTVPGLENIDTIHNYCGLTKTYYDTPEEAQTACTNYCSTGTYYSGGCYTFK